MTQPTTVELLPDNVREDLYSAGHTDESINSMSVRGLMDAFLVWNGIIGYTGKIIAALDGIRGCKEEHRMTMTNTIIADQIALAKQRLKAEYGPDCGIRISFVHSEMHGAIEQHWGVAVDGGNRFMHNAFAGAPSLDAAVSAHVLHFTKEH